MQKPADKTSEHMQEKAKVCKTIAEDKTQESLTGAACDKALNEQAAKEWRIKSQVWTEAEAVVRDVPPEPTPPAK